MPRYSYMQNSFASGQISPKLDGRSDIAEYKNGVSELTNFLPQRSGGIAKRPGLRANNAYPFVNDPDSSTLIIPYQLDAQNIFNLVLISDTQAHFEVETIVTQYDSVSSGFSLFGATGLSQVEYPAADYQYTQVEDKVVLTHASGKIPPLVIVPSIFNNILNLKLVTIFEPDVLQTGFVYSGYSVSNPMADANVTSTNLKLETVTHVQGDYKLTASSGKFSEGDVQSVYILDGSSTADLRSAQFYATWYEDSSTMIGTLVTALPSGFPLGTDLNYWYESSWSESKGYPKTVTFFENRLVFGGTRSEPSSLWLSELNRPFQLNRWSILRSTYESTAALLIYGRTPEQTANIDLISSSFVLPMQFTIASNTPDNITWLAASSNLIVGTSSREYAITGGENGLSSIAFMVRPQTSTGGASIQAVASDSSIYFVSKDRKSIYQMDYSGEAGSYTAKNISTLSDDIMFQGSEDRDDRYNTVFWQSSRNVLWATTTKGKLISISIGSGGIGFALHSVDAKVNSVCANLNADNTHVDMYIAADRDAFSGQSSYTFKMVDDFEHPTLFNTSAYEGDKPMYLDFSLNLTGASTVNWNVSPFHDEDVTVLTKEGLVIVVPVNTTGDIVLATATEEIIVGIAYTAKMATMNLETGVNQLANAQQDIQRIDRVTAKLYKTWAGQYGALSDGDETIYDIELDGTEGETKSIQLDIPMTPSNDNRVIIQSDKPLPITVSGLVFRGVNNQ